MEAKCTSIPVKKLKAGIKVIVETKLDREFDDLLHNSVETENYKETLNGKVALFVEYDCDIQHINGDIEKILAKAEEIEKIYQTVDYPYQVIEIIDRKVAV